jgi:hypothetical protein
MQFTAYTATNALQYFKCTSFAERRQSAKLGQTNKPMPASIHKMHYYLQSAITPTVLYTQHVKSIQGYAARTVKPNTTYMQLCNEQHALLPTLCNTSNVLHLQNDAKVQS